MMLLFFFVLVLKIWFSFESSTDKLYFQNKYNFILHRGEMIWINKSIFEAYDVKTFKYNRTAAALNLRLHPKVDINEFQLNLLGFIQSNNEYKRTVLQFSIDLCKALARNLYGSEIMKATGNLTECPIKKGIIYIPNWKPEESKFPPGIPGGNWKIELKFYVNSFHASTGNIYMEIKYKENWFQRKN